MVIRKVFCQRREMLLDAPLGKWLRVPSYWNWFRYNGELFFRSSNRTMYHHARVTGPHLRRQRHNHIGQKCSLPVGVPLIPTTIDIVSNGISPRGTCAVLATALSTPTTDNKYLSWLHYQVMKEDTTNALINVLQCGQLKAFTDGSYLEHCVTGTAVWTITDENFNEIIRIGTLVPGNKQNMSPFRCELCGILGILDELYRRCPNKEGTITIYCDNETSINAVNEWTVEKVVPSSKNTDLVSAVLRTRDELTITVKGKHIYGHQDAKVAKEHLSIEAQKNVEMDAAAKLLVHTVINSNVTIPSSCNHTNSMSICKWKQEIISQDYRETIYTLIYKEKMRTYWESKKLLTERRFCTIDFEGMQRGMKAMSVTLRRFVSKWMSDCIGTGKNLQRWKLRNEGYCPYCTAPDEDTEHILSCKHEDSVISWKENVRKYLQSLLKAGTCVILLHAIKHDIAAWRFDKPVPSLEQYPTTIRRIIIEQRSIGWQNFLEGLRTHTMSVYMGNFFRRNKSMKTSSQWSSRIHQYGWTLIYNTWDHRNKQLHETKRIADMEGMEHVKTAIRRELQIGIGRLPASDFSHLFREQAEIVLERSNDVLKNWLLIVHQGRILLDENNVISDNFTEKSTLAKWLGLSFSITNKEGEDPFNEAIQQELQNGIGRLPHWFAVYFQQPPDELQSASLKQRKVWLSGIRRGRLRYDQDNLIQDEFMAQGAFKTWLGL